MQNWISSTCAMVAYSIIITSLVTIPNLSAVDGKGSIAEEIEMRGLLVYTVIIDAKEYAITYNFTNGKIINMTATPETASLEITTVTTSDAYLEITMSRELTMLLSGADADDLFPYYYFDIFEDEIPLLSYPHIRADCESVTIGFPVEWGVEEIVLVGTWVIGSSDNPNPLMQNNERYLFYHNVAAKNGTEYKIGILTNADSCDVSLMESEKKLHIGVQGAADKQGYVKLTLPHNVLGGNYTILVDGEVTNNYNTSSVSFQRDRFYTPDILGDATIIEIGYDPQVRSIDIIGTSVIPEFGSLSLIIWTAGIFSTIIVASSFATLKKRWSG